MRTSCYYFADEDVRRVRTNATLAYISNAHYSADWLSVPHTHTCAELFYVLSGSGQFQIGAKCYPVKKHNLILINSQVEHTEIGSGEDPMEYVVLGVNNLEFSQPDTPDEPFCIIDYSAQSEQIVAYLRTMLREAEQQEPDHGAVCQDILNILLTLIMRNRRFRATLSSPALHLSKDAALAKRYIDEHFRESISLELLSNLAHVSKYHLSRSFFASYNVSPISYLVNLRLEESKHLLRTTDHPLAYISRVTGFSSPSYFSQRFKQAEKVSPGQYRQKFRVDNRG